MGLLGDFSKGFVIMIGVFSVFAIIGFIVMEQLEIALVFILALMIPVSMIAFEYRKNKKEEKEKTQSNNQA